MSYFKEHSQQKKTSSEVDGVFSIFLLINNSKDHLEITDNVIRAIKEYYKIEEFNEDYMPILEKIMDRIFKDPIVPNLMIKGRDVPDSDDRKNKFNKKYKL